MSNEREKKQLQLKSVEELLVHKLGVGASEAKRLADKIPTGRRAVLLAGQNRRGIREALLQLLGPTTEPGKKQSESV